VIGLVRGEFGPGGGFGVVFPEPVVFAADEPVVFVEGAAAPEVGVVYAGQGRRGVTPRWNEAGRRVYFVFHRQEDGYADGDVEDVFVLAAVGSPFLLLGTAMQVEDIDFVEGFEQALAHAAMGDAVEVAVVGDEADDAVAGLVNAPLGEADELDVVVVEVELLLVEVAFVVGQQPENPGVAVHLAEVGIGRIAHDDHDLAVALDFGGGVGFARNELAEQHLGALGGFFEGVGEVDAEPLVAAEGVAGGFELHAELEVGDGIGGHEQFEAEQARQEMAADIAVPHAALTLERLLDTLDGEVQEGARAGGRVEDEGVFVGQSPGTVEAGLEQPVERADDVADDGFGGVEDAAHVAQGRIVGGQEGFVEVDDGVFAAFALAEIAQDFAHVGVREQGDHVVDRPGDGVGHARTSDLLEEQAQEGIGARQVLGGGEAGEGLAGGLCAGGEEAVGQRLGEHVGEGVLVEIGNQGLAKGGQPFVQPDIGSAIAGHGLVDGPRVGGLLPLLLVPQRGQQEVAQHAREPGHVAGQITGRGDSQGGLGIERREEGGELRRAVGHGLETPLGIEIGHAQGQPLLAGGIPAEFKVIGQHPVRQGGIAQELPTVRPLAALHLIEVDADILGLDMPDRHTIARDVEIRGAAGDAAGLVGGDDAGVNGFEQRLQRRAVRMLGGVTALDIRAQVAYVVAECAMVGHKVTSDLPVPRYSPIHVPTNRQPSSIRGLPDRLWHRPANRGDSRSQSFSARHTPSRRMVSKKGSRMWRFSAKRSRDIGTWFKAGLLRMRPMARRRVRAVDCCVSIPFVTIHRSISLSGAFSPREYDPKSKTRSTCRTSSNA